MKNIIYTGFFIIAAFVIYAYMNPKADFKSDKKEGIQFFRGNWTDVMAEATKQDKLIFLDIYASWCGPCKRLKNSTFSNSRVGKHFNDNFINVSLDGETGEGEILANRYGISVYPTLLFIDKNGHVIIKGEGYYDPGELIQLSRSAMK